MGEKSKRWVERRGRVPRSGTNEGDGARQRGDGRCAASAPEHGGGVDCTGCPWGGAGNNAERLRVVEAEGTTLTAHNMGCDGRGRARRITSAASVGSMQLALLFGLVISPADDSSSIIDFVLK
jgi:hypothetical protein